VIYDNIEFFNVSELTQTNNLTGLRINRFPSEIINTFDNAMPASFSRGCEISFSKADNGQITIYLMAVDEDGEVLLIFGDYMCNKYSLPKGIITPIHIVKPDLLKKDFEKLNTKSRFSKNICRIFFNNKAIVHYCGMDTYGENIEPPKDNDKPKLSWLAYGSSITHGAGAISNYNSYIQQTARLLGSQVYNFGMSGSCMCEKETADFIAEQKDLDFVMLELGVNMRNGYTPQEFEKRAKYLIEEASKSQKKVFVITIYPNIHTYYNESPTSENEVRFNNILREIIRSKNFNNVYLIEGSEILTNFDTLTQDLIHPSDSGHTEMAYNLYNKISSIIVK
jgi:lysophospholipase L1-like esterase